MNVWNRTAYNILKMAIIIWCVANGGHSSDTIIVAHGNLMNAIVFCGKHSEWIPFRHVPNRWTIIARRYYTRILFKTRATIRSGYFSIFSWHCLFILLNNINEEVLQLEKLHSNASLSIHSKLYSIRCWKLKNMYGGSTFKFER